MRRRLNNAGAQEAKTKTKGKEKKRKKGGDGAPLAGF